MSEDKMVKQYYMNVVNKEEVKGMVKRDQQGRGELADKVNKMFR